MNEEPTEQIHGNHLNETHVLTVAVIGEGLLGFGALIWAHFAGITLPWSFAVQDAAAGLVAALPLAMVSIGFIERGDFGTRIPGYSEFRDKILLPICGVLSFQGSLFISLISGVCEELFFRGAVYLHAAQLFGEFPAILLSSFVFGYVHFIGVAHRFKTLLLLYIGAGMYLCTVFLFTRNLMTVMTTHAVYNFLVIEYVRRSLKSERPADE